MMARRTTGTRGVSDWLSLAAAPVFASMAVLTAVLGGGASDTICSAAHGGSLLSGMAPMYSLMAAFHLAPWVKLGSVQRTGLTR